MEVFFKPSTLVPAYCRLLGEQRKTGTDAAAQARKANQGLGRRAAARSLDAEGQAHPGQAMNRLPETAPRALRPRPDARSSSRSVLSAPVEADGFCFAVLEGLRARGLWSSRIDREIDPARWCCNSSPADLLAASVLSGSAARCEQRCEEEPALQ